MLNIVLFDGHNEISWGSFLDQNLPSVRIICPSPLIADGIRNRTNLLKDLNIDVITISRFIGYQFDAFFPEKSIVRKSELLMDLGTLWKLKFRDFPGDTFFLVFKLFTELRSFTLSADLIAEIHNEFEDHIAQAIELFWRYLDSVEYCDEQKSYGLLTESYRVPGLESEKELQKETLVFYGFSHFSAGQVDLIKSLGQYHDVFVPIPSDVYRESMNSDWTKWFEEANFIEEKINEKDEKLGEQNINKLQTIVFPKNRLSEGIEGFLSKESNTAFMDIVLATKGPDFEQFNEIPVRNAYFKVNTTIFTELLEELIELLRNKLTFPVESIEVLKFINNILRKELKKNNKNFRKIRVLHSFISLLDSWVEKSKENDFLHQFDLKILKLCLDLDLPRSSMGPLLSHNPYVTVKGIEGIDSFREESVKLICASSTYRSLKGNEGQFSEEILSFLSSIGPIQRRGLEFQFLKLKIERVLREKNAVLVIEHGLEESDPAWNEILKGFEVERIDDGRKKILRKPSDYLKDVIKEVPEKIEYISANRLQTYHDCPRKYYLQYISMTYKGPEVYSMVTPRDLGILQHLLIEEAFTEKISSENANFIKLCRDRFRDFLKERNVFFSRAQEDIYLFEIIAYSRNGLAFLEELQRHIPDAKFEFEKKIEGEGIRGSIDCFVTWGQRFAIIDFKRSSNSIPSAREIETYDKIQLWFYLFHSGYNIDDLFLWGYLNLGDPSESLIYGKGEYLSLENKDMEIRDLFLDFNERIDNFASFLNRLDKSMRSDRTFLANPRKKNVCIFCPYMRVCIKGESL